MTKAAQSKSGRAQPGSSAAPRRSLGLSPQQRSYVLQYTSLIMIVLTFVVGAFVRCPIKPPSAASIAAPEKIRPLQALVGSLEYSNLFPAGGAGFDREQLEALAGFAGNHDVSLDLEIYTGRDSGEGESRLETALERSAEVYRYLLSKGLSADSASVWVQDQSAAVQARLRVFRDEN